ncbi:MAG: hypothetical protein GTN76_05925 [Candidatus Aenigmarchaeota archaeon]|nr:hypothetical protein [Candidatus Aenigmarchaeota archaeon]
MNLTIPAGRGIIWKSTRPRKREMRTMGISDWLLVIGNSLSVIREWLSVFDLITDD